MQVELKSYLQTYEELQRRLRLANQQVDTQLAVSAVKVCELLGDFAMLRRAIREAVYLSGCLRRT